MQLFWNYLFHPFQVGHSAFTLADPDDLVSRWDIAFLLHDAGGQLDAANSNARQMLRFHLKTTASTMNTSPPSTLCLNSNCVWKTSSSTAKDLLIATKPGVSQLLPSPSHNQFHHFSWSKPQLAEPTRQHRYAGAEEEKFNSWAASPQAVPHHYTNKSRWELQFPPPPSGSARPPSLTAHTNPVRACSRQPHPSTACSCSCSTTVTFCATSRTDQKTDTTSFFLLI